MSSHSSLLRRFMSGSQCVSTQRNVVQTWWQEFLHTLSEENVTVKYLLHNSSWQVINSERRLKYRLHVRVLSQKLDAEISLSFESADDELLPVIRITCRQFAWLFSYFATSYQLLTVFKWSEIWYDDSQYWFAVIACFNNSSRICWNDWGSPRIVCQSRQSVGSIWPGRSIIWSGILFCMLCELVDVCSLYANMCQYRFYAPWKWQKSHYYCS